MAIFQRALAHATNEDHPGGDALFTQHGGSFALGDNEGALNQKRTLVAFIDHRDDAL